MPAGQSGQIDVRACDYLHDFSILENRQADICRKSELHSLRISAYVASRCTAWLLLEAEAAGPKGPAAFPLSETLSRPF